MATSTRPATPGPVSACFSLNVTSLPIGTLIDTNENALPVGVLGKLDQDQSPTERPQTVRRKNSEIQARVNGQLSVRFTGRGLTSYAGLELLRAYLQQIGFSRRLRQQLQGVAPVGDFSTPAMVALIIAMLVVGGSRLRHVGHLLGDPVVQRFCSLAVLPTARTLSRWLGRCKRVVRSALLTFNAELIGDTIRPLDLRRLTVDVDGTVISTGLQVERAFRGFNPHRRKVPSYYPITAHLAQTGHLLRVQNRSGNVHDGKGSPPFFRDLCRQLDDLAPKALIEFRLDGAFFRREIIIWLERRTEYTIKVPFYHWVGLKKLVEERKRWNHVRPGLDGFTADVWIKSWKRYVHVAIYRKKVAHKTKKNFQLDLFDPSDGHWEYSAIATNKDLSLKFLWDFMAGRGSHEKVLAELKTGYAFDTVPTQNYAANSTWQILSMLAHNVVTNFQIETGAQKRGRTTKRSPLYLLKSIRSLRYELFNKAGIVQRPAGRATLTLARNMPTRKLFERVGSFLARAA